MVDILSISSTGSKDEILTALIAGVKQGVIDYGLGVSPDPVPMLEAGFFNDESDTDGVSDEVSIEDNGTSNNDGGAYLRAMVAAVYASGGIDSDSEDGGGGGDVYGALLDEDEYFEPDKDELESDGGCTDDDALRNSIVDYDEDDEEDDGVLGYSQCDYEDDDEDNGEDDEDVDSSGLEEELEEGGEDTDFSGLGIGGSTVGGGTQVSFDDLLSDDDDSTDYWVDSRSADNRVGAPVSFDDLLSDDDDSTDYWVDSRSADNRVGAPVSNEGVGSKGGTLGLSAFGSSMSTNSRESGLKNASSGTGAVVVKNKVSTTDSPTVKNESAKSSYVYKSVEEYVRAMGNKATLSEAVRIFGSKRVKVSLGNGSVFLKKDFLII